MRAGEAARTELAPLTAALKRAISASSSSAAFAASADAADFCARACEHGGQWPRGIAYQPGHGTERDGLAVRSFAGVARSRHGATDQESDER
jgi:hypothetical protein